MDVAAFAVSKGEQAACGAIVPLAFLDRDEALLRHADPVAAADEILEAERAGAVGLRRALAARQHRRVERHRGVRNRLVGRIPTTVPATLAVATCAVATWTQVAAKLVNSNARISRLTFMACDARAF